MIRSCRTLDYNWNFNTVTGPFQRWGRTIKDDPKFSPLGAEILDIEVTTICNNGCKFCYKSNTSNGKNMSFETFKVIIDKMPSNLVQLAFGVDSNATSNPDLFKMAEYARSQNAIPNITIANTSNETADKLVNMMGAISVSNYSNDQCFGTVDTLTSRGAKYVNIHQLLSKDSIPACLDLIKQSKTDKRLSNLNAIVFLMLKPKGRAKDLGLASFDEFKQVVNFALENEVSIGFDSCSSPTFLKMIENDDRFEEFSYYIEPCESFLFSSYCNVDGEFFPCSFAENTPGWETGLKVTKETDFLKDIWFHEKMVNWRNNLLESTKDCNCSIKHLCRCCPIYKNVSLCTQ